MLVVQWPRRVVFCAAIDARADRIIALPKPPLHLDAILVNEQELTSLRYAVFLPYVSVAVNKLPSSSLLLLASPTGVDPCYLLSL